MISVIIPTLDEASFLPATIAHLQANAAAREIVVVDGGSGDNTIEVAESKGCRVIASPEQQRAGQMNLGARNAVGSILLFLHADTLAPSNALARIAQTLGNPKVVGGGFARRFADGSLFLKITCLLAECRTRCLGWFLGDQGIFVRRTVFEAMGGFREVSLFEDLDFSRRLARSGRVVTLRPPVIASPRRFAARGPLVTTWADFWLTCRYLSGADPGALAGQGSLRFRAAPNTRRVRASHS